MPLVDPGSAIRLSLCIGFWCAAVGLPPAVALGWLLARGRFYGKTALSTLVLSPLVLPPVVTGYLLLRLLGRGSAAGGFLARAGIEIPFSLAGAVAAALVVGFPLYVMAARAAFEAVDPRLEDVSASLGRGPWSTFRRVTLPLALPGLAAGAVLAFARALGEFGATVVLAGNIEGRTRGIALAVYTLLESPRGAERIEPLLWASVGMSFAALLGCEWLWRRQKAKTEARS